MHRRNSPNRPPTGRGRPRRGVDSPRAGEIYLEFTTIGTSTKVVAIDAATGVEVTVAGPASASRAELERVAVQKLNKRLRQSKTP